MLAPNKPHSLSCSLDSNVQDILKGITEMSKTSVTGTCCLLLYPLRLPGNSIARRALLCCRYEPQLKPDISERSESTRRSRSKERPSHSCRDHRDHSSTHDRRDHESSRSHRRSHHSPDRAASDKQRFTDSKAAADESEQRSPRQVSESRPDHPEQPRPGWQGPDFGGRGRGNFSDRGSFGRGGYVGRGLGRGRGQFDGSTPQNFNQVGSRHAHFSLKSWLSGHVIALYTQATSTTQQL